MNAIGARRRAGRSHGAEVERNGLFRALGRIVSLVVFAVIPAAVLIALIAHGAGAPAATSFWDFHAFWDAGRAVIHGRTPYPPASDTVLGREGSFVYPAPAAVAMVPLALLPYEVAATLFALALVGSIVLALRLVGVRDWRCYGLALLSAPVVTGVNVDAVSPILLLGLALVWRFRDRVVPAAFALAGLVVLKLFLWPLLLWCALTRRVATALMAGAIITVVTIAAWAGIGFDGLRAYPDVLRILTRLLEGKSYSLVALGLSLGANRELAQALSLLVGAAALAAVAIRGRRTSTDAWTFAVATGAVLALTPIAWLHYFVLLYVPIAIVRPRLSWLWATPLAFWVLSGQSVQPPLWDKQVSAADLARTAPVGHWWTILYAVVVVAGILAIVARSAEPARPGSVSR
jgi:hypothetical protein